MTTRKLHAKGTVFKYPYKWHRETPEDPQPKERPACIILEITAFGGSVALAIVAISDKPNEAMGLSLQVPVEELRRAGLSQFRAAYVHLDQYNIDRRDNSYNYNPRAKMMGDFSPKFTARLAQELAANIRARRATPIDRK